MKSQRKFRIEHGDVFEYSEDHNAYIYLTSTTTIVRNSRFSKITEKTVLEAVREWEDHIELCRK